MLQGTCPILAILQLYICGLNSVDYLGDKIGALVHVFEALPWSFDSAKVMGATRAD
jgi:hypothetical protein